MVEGFIDIKKLTLDELSGVVNLYPWYGGARMELCRRMAELGAWSMDKFAEAALYVSSRRKVAALAGSVAKADCSDESIRLMVNSEMEKVRESYRGVGDYFSLDAYRAVKKEEDNIFSSFARADKDVVPEEPVTEDISNYYTETLAGLYLEQGYPEQAVEIYSKLSLRYPEKSVYFASLIEKINKQ